MHCKRATCICFNLCLFLFILVLHTQALPTLFIAAHFLGVRISHHYFARSSCFFVPETRNSSLPPSFAVSLFFFIRGTWECNAAVSWQWADNCDHCSFLQAWILFCSLGLVPGLMGDKLPAASWLLGVMQSCFIVITNFLNLMALSNLAKVAYIIARISSKGRTH